MSKLYFFVLATALFCGVYAALTSHWLTLIGSACVILYFVINPYELD
jgi:hypothetical protein